MTVHNRTLLDEKCGVDSDNYIMRTRPKSKEKFNDTKRWIPTIMCPS